MTHPSLTSLGWTADFLRQLSPEDLATLAPARVARIHRSRVDALTESGPVTLIPPPDLSTGQIAVGDWVLADGERLVRLLDRKSCLVRRAAGTRADGQLIAANVDTVFITTSCNADFNEARLERFLALSHDGGVQAVLVVTKADLSDHPDDFLARLARIAPNTPALTLDARDPQAAARLLPWCWAGQTVVFVGSSGVGKSTLINALTGLAIDTRGIREDDAKGRHTTTARELHPLPGGGWLIDTPGMRELSLTDASEAIDETFAEITDLAQGCRFSDCTHETEPGCAVRAAVEAGLVDPDRLRRWEKLRREDAFNSATMAENRARSRSFGRMIHSYHKGKKRRGDA